MKDSERNRYETFMRIRQFGVENSADFPAGSIGATQFAVISTEIDKLEEETADQSASFGDARFAYANKAIAREEVREGCSEISRTARAMVYQFPGIDVKFRMPRNRNDADLLSAARAFVDEAEFYEADFVTYGLPATFLGDLRDDISTFEAAIPPTGEAIDARVEATAETAEAIGRGMVARRILDGVVKNTYRNSAGKLAAWESAKHIEKLPKNPPPTP